MWSLARYFLPKAAGYVGIVIGFCFGITMRLEFWMISVPVAILALSR